MTDQGEILYASFGIEKVESTPDGDLMVYGKASDGSIDSDQQIVDPKWMKSAIQEWLATGANLRVQHNPQRDPAGIGITANTDDHGATWVKSLVVEPIAQKLVAKGALRAYSVGIARPTIENDITAKGGRITGGTLVELSLVDRPANKGCGIQLVKSADDGSLEYTGKMFGSDDEIQKMLNGDVAEKSETAPDMSFQAPDLSVTFTPDDLMKIVQSKMVEKHYDELAIKAVADAEDEALEALKSENPGDEWLQKDHREFSAEQRRHHAAEGNALPDGSYPIPDADALRRAAILARSKHGNWKAASRLIARRARELGVSNPMDSGDSEKGASVPDAATPEVIKDEAAETEVTEAKEAEADVTKDPEGEKAKKPAKGKKMPPWLQGDDDGDSDSDSCKMDHAHTEKCTPSGTPKSTSGAKDAADMNAMPNPGAAETSPMPPGIASDACKGQPEASALLRFKTIGMDPDIGRLHDMTCPAYDPELTAKYHPYAEFSSLIDEAVWMRKALEAASGPTERAMSMAQLWNAVTLLKKASPGMLNDFRAEMHKAFRDANPGPTTYPTPGSMSPSSYNRPVITAGHAANSPGYDGPNSSPDVASGTPNATHFDRPPLGAGHQTPSPSFMKRDGEFPSEQGVPVQLTYAVMEKEQARQALVLAHEHLSRMFPDACPMAQGPSVYPEHKPVPSVVGKSEDEPVEEGVVKAEPEVTEDLAVKGRKKQIKKLGKKVMQGKITLDQARGALGNRSAMKTEEDSVRKQYESGLITREQAMEALGFTVEKSEAPAVIEKAETGDGNSLTPDILKTMMSEILAPFTAKIAAQDELIASQQKTLDAIADQPDPSTASFSGLALKVARPAAVKTQAEIAEHAQSMIRRNLQHTYNTHSNPAVREAAGEALSKLDL
jgi:hypothetical protein